MTNEELHESRELLERLHDAAYDDFTSSCSNHLEELLGKHLPQLEAPLEAPDETGWWWNELPVVVGGVPGWTVECVYYEKERDVAFRCGIAGGVTTFEGRWFKALRPADLRE